MAEIHSLIEGNIIIAWATLAVAFAILAKSADLFVDGSVGLANRLRIPKLVIGIFLVSLATTGPELSVSLISALRGQPEMALGNAVGSVIVDDGLALGLAGILTVSPILIIPHVLKSAGVFLVTVQILTFLLVVQDGVLQRWEGALLVALFFAYTTYHFRQHRSGRFKDDLDLELVEQAAHMPLAKMIAYFVLGITGIILTGSFIITAATTIARSAGIPEAVIALTLVALGTSIPEVATCIAAARKGEGALAVGNIIGADIMNICWIAGASAIANDLALEHSDIYFMFPAMFIIVGAMLLMLRQGYRLTRAKGAALLLLYAAYIGSFWLIYRPA